ncbi:hypothetical protein [Nitrosomonas ureae]|uniref:Uncharacterized protein n=1 Tax=Nitrosomonas ureae TaxID=44577 RepID=A0A0S3AFC6_9PROT|nr:hypothetical protein [Nitrosomonas ureae]MBY0499243.1 hypothetical protein [Nitrosomonas sp.]ALQ49885.1 hypothetical protein ATY38_00680 [Nitrosomonas ureae]PXX16763.1 hypothetical protein C8R27_105113 [Nitrosomonas ureae]SDT84811.1 hypothetical protein SAMN05216406_102120 [Nitrosomonas ureae]SEP75581.1 hypothetical protein SAMN05421510_1003122 [Nitrosomonas ureae]
MLTYLIIVLAIAAVGGVVLAMKIFSGQLAPWSLSIVHALLGATGLVMLILLVLEGSGDGRLTAALGLLVVAALGGFYLASIHVKGSIAPKNVVLIHAGVAVAGFLTLLSLFI